MPELPEVETIRRSLLPYVGSRIVGVEIRERRLRRTIADDFTGQLRGRRVESIDRRGKYLFFGLDGDRALLAHLGMTGCLERRPSSAPSSRHDHVRFLLDSDTALVFHDPRRFGILWAGPRNGLTEFLPTGQDPLLRPLSAQDLRQLARNRRGPIKNLLMDQNAVAGIGNIYASEILHRAGIRPRRRAARIYVPELTRLADAIHEVLEHAVRLGGSSISDFHDINGRTGYFQLEHAVYDRDGKPCPRCQTTIRRIVQSGRSSFYCRTCQH